MHRPKTRWGACGIHFCISLVIFIVIVAVMLLYWYPGALFQSAGGWQGLRIVAGVDLVLGPLLTLVIYNAAKPLRELTIDLSIIAVFQFACLAAGLYVVVQERPAVAIYALDTFHTLKHKEITAKGISPETIAALPGSGLKLVYIELPDDPSQAHSVVAMGEFMGDSVITREDLYRSLVKDKNNAPAIFASGAQPGISSSCYTVELATSYESGTVCYNPDTHRFSDFKPK